MTIRFEWDDKTYTYDPDAITVAQAVTIKEHTGAGLISWQGLVNDVDPHAMQALLWVIKAQNGEPCQIGTLELNPLKFWRALLASSDADQPEEAPDPTAGVDSRTPGSTPT